MIHGYLAVVSSLRENKETPNRFYLLREEMSAIGQATAYAPIRSSSYKRQTMRGKHKICSTASAATTITVSKEIAANGKILS